MVACGHAVPVCDFDLPLALGALKPDVLIDARMRKYVDAECQRGLAPMTVGLGPGFVAGETTDLVIETAPGPSLGKIVRAGRALSPTHEPTPLGGVGAGRFALASAHGTFRTPLDIGDSVDEGQVVGTVDDAPQCSPLTGWIRGIAHDGASVDSGMRLLEVDPSRTPGRYDVIGGRPARVADVVLALVDTVVDSR